MKKSLKIFSVIVLMLILLTGCVNVNYEITLNEDGTADVAYVYGFEKQYLENMETTAEEMTADMQQNAELSDYKVEAFSDEKLEGFKASKHLTDLSQISLEEVFGEENVTDSEDNKIKIEKKGSKTVYSQKAEIDLTSMEDSMSSMVKMKYTIKLPIKSGKNNATEVSKDGKTLTWNLKAGEVNKIEFEATEAGKMEKIIKIVVIIVASLIGFAIVIAGVMAIVKKWKNSKVENQNVDIQETGNEEEIIQNENETNNNE